MYHLYYTGVQSLQELCIATITSAVLDRTVSHEDTPCEVEPEAKLKDLRAKLPDYIPPTVKQCVLNSFKYTKIILSHQF